MAVLTTKARKAMPTKEFGLPGKRAYPMPDREHAINAKARATQEYRAGKLTKNEKADIFAMANRMLHKEG